MNSLFESFSNQSEGPWPLRSMVAASHSFYFQLQETKRFWFIEIFSGAVLLGMKHPSSWTPPQGG